MWILGLAFIQQRGYSRDRTPLYLRWFGDLRLDTAGSVFSVLLITEKVIALLDLPFIPINLWWRVIFDKLAVRTDEM